MRALFVGSLLALAATAANAADNGFYVGAGITQSKVDDILSTGVKIDDTQYKLIAGFRPLGLISAEVNYMDLGSKTVSSGTGTGTVDAKAFAAFALLSPPLPIPFLDVYAKAGLARWKLDGQVNTTGVSLFSANDKGTEFAYGAGAMVSFGSWSARLEYEQFDIANTDGLKLATLGLTYTLL